MTARNLRRFLSMGAVAGVLASSAYIAAPASATEEPGISPTPGTAASDGGTRLSEAALADAVQRDLGLSPEEFSAAGELGARAAEAAVQLRDVPGYAGIRLEAGQIVVTGWGAGLFDKVAALAVSIPELVVDAPMPEAKAGNLEDSAAPDPAVGSELAVSTEQLFQAYVREVGAEGLQAVVSAGGKFVIRTGGINTPESSSHGGDPSAPAAGPGKVSPAEFVARYANVELDAGTRLAPEADVPGGVGYIADTGWVCSTGFSAFDPAGVPAVLSAGHCASDGEAQTATLEFQFNQVGLLGHFGFSQFGGPGNSRIIEDPLDPNNPANVGTDISVIESLRSDIDPLPAASTWGDPSEPGPDVKIIGSTDPVVGMPVCRSGRTSAWSCGAVDAVGIFVVPGPGYASDPTDLRAFRGFLSYAVQSSGGDSGGPYVSGNYAVGTHAAGDTPDANGNVIENFAVAATLSESLAVLPGYQLELFLNKPTVTSPAPGGTYEPGQIVSGTIPAAPASAIAAGSRVRITVENGEPFEVPVDAAGNWSFTAPGPPEGNQALRFTAEAVNGFSASGINSFEFPPVPNEAPAPPAPAPDPVEPPAPAPAPAPADPAPAPPADSPDGGAAVVLPAATPPADLAHTGRSGNPRYTGGLANTGASPLLPAAGAAAAAITVGGVLMVLVRRRKRSG
ncbi:peptidase [Pseudarthrobacter sp. NamE2]|uniref:S1 family peptidase n=1 Tax=Pseudarthrobacter sp. NamE2 TaxID=2576838 RepID=UPI0010FE57F7|nr:S1 family peptidase [Pseudarthrobacter sp. NamE2]TLM84458.1 peptidase [Pseudarthrobacter sp. NamE2]